MGLICGRSRGIGVAPGATWIACKASAKNGTGSEEYFLTCGQWILDQRPLPHIINNSWRGDVRNKTRWFDDIIAHWRAVGIIPVFGIGNSGPECGTANYPGNHENVIGVGSTDIKDSIAYSCSRGPSNDSGLVKPDVSAPAVYVLSASNSDPEAYEVTSGTIVWQLLMWLERLC